MVSIAYADMCDFVYKPNNNKIISSDLAHIDKINRLERVTSFIRKLRSKGQEEFVLITRRMQDEFKAVEGLIFRGDIDLAVRKWRTIFRKVETSAIEAQNYNLMIRGVNKGIRLHVTEYESLLIKEAVPKYIINRHIKDLNKLGGKEYLSYLHKELRKHHRNLGNNFEKYKFIKNNLDDLFLDPNCTALCKQSIKNLYDEISIASPAQRELFRNLLGSRKKIKLSAVEKVFNSHPEAIVLARRKEFLAETFGLLKKYFNNANVMQSLYLYLGNTAARKNLKLVRMFKRIFDQRYHSVNKGIINKVTHSTKTPKDQLELIKLESKYSDYDGILVDMSRSPDKAVKDAWAGLKNYASESPQRASLLKELELAEQLGIKIGKSSNKMPKDVSTLIGAMVIGGGFAGYMLFDVEQQEEDDQTNDDGVMILDIDDLDQIQDDDDVIILKYNSELDNELRQKLLEIADSLAQVEANLSTD